MREVDPMKHTTKKPKTKRKTMYAEVGELDEDLFERCVRKGLIEVTPYGLYFTPEFFETLSIYEK
jgi:hypothetical protein